MDFSDYSLQDFVTQLSSDAPTPGGGGVAALVSSTGAALSLMVLNLTKGKEKYVAFEPFVNETIEKLSALNERLFAGIDKDKEVFGEVSAIYAMPKTTEAEKQLRSEKLQVALQSAAAVPYQLMEDTYEALQLTKQLIGQTNKGIASDIGVAAVNLKAGLEGAWVSVLINLKSMKDESFISSHKASGQAIFTKGCQLADEIYQEILSLYV